MSQSYYIKSNLIVRGDLRFCPEYVAYNIENGEMYDIGKDVFTVLWRISRGESVSDKNIEVVKKFLFIDSEHSDNIPLLYPEFKRKLISAYYPREIEIHLTSYCNLRCLHCVYDIKTKKSKALSCDKFIKLFDECEKMGVFRIILSGGEPLLYEHIDEILMDLSKRKIRVEILTNATLIDDKKASLLSSKNFSVTYSLDGHNAKTCDFLRGKGSFDRIIKGVGRLNKFNVKHNASCVIHKKNYEYAQEIIKLCEKLNSVSVNFLFLDLMGRAERFLSDMSLSREEMKQFISKINAIKSKIPVNFLDSYNFLAKPLNYTETIYCSAGTSRCAINSEGDVYPCVYAFNGGDFRMGNINEKSLNEIWKDSKWDFFRGGISSKDLKECIKCKHFKYCQLKNCRLRAYFKYKDIYARYPGCEATDR